MERGRTGAAPRATRGNPHHVAAIASNQPHSPKSNQQVGELAIVVWLDVFTREVAAHSPPLLPLDVRQLRPVQIRRRTNIHLRDELRRGHHRQLVLDRVGGVEGERLAQWLISQATGAHVIRPFRQIAQHKSPRRIGAREARSRGDVDLHHCERRLGGIINHEPDYRALRLRLLHGRRLQGRPLQRRWLERHLLRLHGSLQQRCGSQCVPHLAQRSARTARDTVVEAGGLVLGQESHVCKLVYLPMKVESLETSR